MDKAFNLKTSIYFSHTLKSCLVNLYVGKSISNSTKPSEENFFN